MRFHLSRGQPVIPSKVRFRLHELEIKVDGVLDLTQAELLAQIGINMGNLGRLPYLERHGECEACQKGVVHIFGSSGCNAASPPIGEVGLAPVFEAAFDGEQSVGARLRPAASGWRNSASCALPAMMPSAAR